MNGTKPQDKQKGSRLAFIDWTRGLAAVIMIQGHTFDSFTATGLRKDGPFMLSQFLGGMPPAFFLFLTGVTFSFLMDSQERQQPSARQTHRSRLEAFALSVYSCHFVPPASLRLWLSHQPRQRNFARRYSQLHGFVHVIAGSHGCFYFPRED